MKEVFNKKYVFMWAEENENYYDSDYLLLNYSDRPKKLFGFGLNEIALYYKDFHCEFYLTEKELKRSSELGYKFLSNPKKYKFLVREIKKAKKHVLKDIDDLIKKDFQKLSDEEFYQAYNSLIGIGRIFTCYSMTQPEKLTKLEAELRKFLERRKMKAEDVPQVLSTIVEPKIKFVFPEKEEDFFKSFSETVKKEDFKIDKKLAKKEFFQISKVRQTERNKIIKELNPPAKILHLIEVVRTLSELRLRMRLNWMKAYYFGELFLIELKRRHKITKENLRMYSTSELEMLIKYRKKVPIDLLKERLKGLVKIYQDGKTFIFTGEDVDRFIKKVKNKNQTKIIKGVIASPGKASGRVVILSFRKADKHSQKIKEMKTGDILVSEMTRPSIILACKKAGAIITDEGGILCHAAIVSRELKKPCIIGTKIATQVLKDGDEVEVDAENGLIKILK